jgi:tRNA(Ser,Leu) C12 N-acetylase TAN1
LGSETSGLLRRGTAKIIVTSRELYAARQTITSLRAAVPGARIRGAGFRGIFILEAEGDALELAEKVNRECFLNIGRAIAVLAEVQSTIDAIKEAAVRVSSEHIGVDEKFCFRLHKRGSHWLEQDTPKIEHEIGGAIWAALREKYGEKPNVDLEDPDVTLVAEVLGPNTAIGIVRKAWRMGPT